MKEKVFILSKLCLDHVFPSSTKTGCYLHQVFTGEQNTISELSMHHKLVTCCLDYAKTVVTECFICNPCMGKELSVACLW